MNDQNQQIPNTSQPINMAPQQPQKSDSGKIVLIVVLAIGLPFILAMGAFLIFGTIMTSMLNSISTSTPDIDMDEPETTVLSTDNSIVAGTWDCYTFDGRGANKADGYESTMKLTRFGDFVYGEYGNEDVNHYKGTYEATDLKKTNGNGSYKYYSLDFTSTEFSLDGVKKSGADASLSDAEIGITDGADGRELIMAFESTGNMYYCYERN